MVEMVRVTLVPKGADGEDAADRQIILDLTVDPAGTAVGPFPAFGRAGDFRKPDTLYPFTLMMDGRMDYGACAPAEAEPERLQIRSAHLAIGAEIARIAGDRRETFVITAMTTLTGS